VQFTRNNKRIAGLSIILTVSAFMIAAYGSLSRLPLPIVAVYLTAILIGGGLGVVGPLQEKKITIPARN
jgi:hypothetical protein